MINVNQITAQLARMPDQALQQYAQMHKNDPYVLSLALSEANRRKQMRQGAQAQAPEQPKVVDQVVASMATPMPEDVGIAKLPTGEMSYADGGIVAFSDGGDVPRYQSGGSMSSAFSTYLQNTGQVSRYANGTAAQRAAIEAGFRYNVQGPFAPTAASAPAAQTTAPAASASSVPRALGRLAAGTTAAGLATIPAGIAQGLTSAMGYTRDMGMPIDPMGEFGTGEATPEQATFDEDRRQRILQKNAQQRAEDSRLTAVAEGRTPTTPAAATPSGSYTSAMYGSGPAARQTSGAGPRRTPAAPAASADPAAVSAATVATPKAGGFDMTPEGLMALRKKLDTEIKVEDPNAKAREDLAQARIAAAKSREEAIKRDQELFADAFRGREERLTKRGEELGKSKDTNTGLALLSAGLSIMSTPGSLATAIGKGAQVGTNQYAAGLDKLRSAQEKLDEARDRLDDLKLNRAEMSAKERRDAEAGVQNAILQGKQDGIAALDRMFDLGKKDATAMFGALTETGLGILRETEATKRTGMTVAAQRDATAATRENTEALRLAGLLETTRKNIADEAIKKFPFDAAAREQYERTAFQAALRTNPRLAQYAGVAGGGNAPTADLKFNERTGQFEPVR